MRIIARYRLGHWSARFDNGSPDSFGAPDAFASMRRLLENSPARLLTLDDFEPDLEEYFLNRVEMVLKDRDRGDQEQKDIDPECGGTGKYIGL